MADTQRLGTGRSSEFVDSGGGGGASIADIYYKQFFTDIGMLPVNVFKEAFSIFPAEDWSNFGGSGTYDRYLSRGRFKSTANRDNRFGFDLLAPKSEILMIVGGMRLRSPFLSQIGLGSDIVQSVVEGLFGPGDPNPAAGFKMQGTVGGTDQMVDEAFLGNTTDKEFSLAVYFNTATPISVGFVKFGDMQWFPVCKTATPGMASKRFPFFRFVPFVGGEEYHFVCPLIIRTN
jgi:hypothetical protein